MADGVRRSYRDGAPFMVWWFRISAGLTVAFVVGALLTLVLGMPVRYAGGLLVFALMTGVSAAIAYVDDGSPPGDGPAADVTYLG